MNDPGRGRRNARVGLIMLAVVAAMLGLGFAAVPLYRVFCQKTGFGGTPKIVDEAQAATIARSDKQISIRFDSNVAPGMTWQFHPEQVTQQVRLGERTIAFFIAKNDSDQPITGQASYNIEPEQAASFFNKVQCFCFTQQTLQPHQEVRMPVTYYVDPAILKDKDAKDVQQITLSYTFYNIGKPKS
jgi:cytochrome c oxidase assembly protein subunit 11